MLFIPTPFNLKGRIRTQIANSAGVLIGNLIGGGGLAAAFDGNVNQTQAQGSESAGGGASNSGYNNTVGKDWGVGQEKVVTKFIIYGPSNDDLLGGGAGNVTTAKLQASSDGVNWVDLATTENITGHSSVTNTSSGIIMTMAYRFHRINVNGNGANSISIAEVQFFEDI
jgi:hypothetical protein